MYSSPATRERRFDAQIYRDAAKLMESDRCPAEALGSCCWAIRLTKKPSRPSMWCATDRHCRAMKRVYAPRQWHGYWMEIEGESRADAHNRRILALCFMAAMVEAGDA